jgi:heme a synthase
MKSKWLYLVAALVFTLVIVGGATRLTGSGLSITEWRPVTGILLPFSHEAWMVEFEKYKAIPQYVLVNKGISLAEFKVLFFWEWGHRLLARVTGLALLLPFLYFVFKGSLRGAKAWRVFGIGCLIALQGFIGWIMVASGLTTGMVAVAPIKLMLHLTLAAIIFTLLLREAGEVKLRGFEKIVLILLLLQIALGALVAGNNAGLVYNTFPLMNGKFIPDNLFFNPLWIENFIDNNALVQFNHRLLAYILTGMVLFGAFTGRISKVFAGAVLLQAAIGITTLLLVVPFSLALLHQAAAFALIFVFFKTAKYSYV